LVRAVRVVAVALMAALAAGCSSTVAGRGTLASGAAPSSNGVASLSPPQILAKARTALENAASVHVKGLIVDQGDRIHVDIRIKRSAGGRGTLTVNGQTVELIRVGAKLYLRADEAFWRSQTGNAEVGKLLGGKYLVAPATHPDFKDLAGIADLKWMSEQLANDAPLTKGKHKNVRGTDAIGLVDSGTDGGVLYVALQGQPYPLRLEPNDTGTGESIDYLDYGKPVTLTAPPASQVIDITKLGGR
jgi:hypothetical protein